RVGNAADGVGTAACFERGAVDALADRSDGAVLLLDRDGNGPGDGGDFLNDAVDLFDRVSGVGDRGLDGADLAGNFLSGFGSLAGERLDLGGHYRKALAGFAGARRFDGGVERQKIGLTGDRLNEPRDL